MLATGGTLIDSIDYVFEKVSGNLEAGWRTTVFNGDYIEFNSTSGGFVNFTRAGTSRLQLTTTGVNVVGSIVLSGATSITGGATISSGAAITGNTTITSGSLTVSPSGGAGAVIGGRQTGFGLPTGTYNTAAFNTSTVTLTQLAQYVAGMMSRLHSSTSGAHFLFGP
jgi:hypothetical protein